MSGVLEEIPMPDLLQLLSTGRKSGVLTFNHYASIGKIYLRRARRTLQRSTTILDQPQKSIYRMLTWLTGTFEPSRASTSRW